MAVWAYVCHPCEPGPQTPWYVRVAQLADMPTETRILRVKVGASWHCAIVDRAARISVEEMLTRDAIASSEDDCPACREHLARTASIASAAPAAAARQAPAHVIADDSQPAQPGASSGSFQAAAISLQGTRLVVVLVSLDLVESVGEADMAIDKFMPSFGGVPIVLMAQDEDGSPRYYGDPRLVQLLTGVPLERMPWKDYPIR